MANEAVIIELIHGGDPIRFTCATAIAKGTLLELTDPRTVIANTNDNAPVVGIAAMETDGTETSITAYTNGIFDMLTLAGAKNVGSCVANSTTENTVQPADAADLLQGAVVGFLMEADAGGVVSAVRVLK
jgi:hypothetical protein